MALPLLADFEFARWSTWAIPALGLVGVFLTLTLGRVFFAGRGKKKAVAPVAEDPASGFQSLQKGGWSERRHAPRRKGKVVRVYVAALEEDAVPEEGWIVDRSTSGLCIAVEHTRQLGTKIKVRACEAPKALPWVHAQVKHSRQDGNGWELGCEFEEAPQWGVLLHFG